MKRYVILLVLAISCVNQTIGQEFVSHTSLSLFAGIQNPVEVTILDFSGNGSRDLFNPGSMVGIGVNFVEKRYTLNMRGTYGHNKMKNFSAVEQNSNLHNFSFRGDAWLNVLNPDSKFRLEVGVGLGMFFFRHPGSTYFASEETSVPGLAYVQEPHNVSAFSLNNGINLNYAVSKRFDLFGALGNDLVLPYADEVVAVLRAAAVGVNYKL
jgi:hypothetical protein